MRGKQSVSRSSTPPAAAPASTVQARIRAAALEKPASAEKIVESPVTPIQMERPMATEQTFKFPFAETDFTKFFGEFKLPQFGDVKLPTVNVEGIVEAQRKNVAALTTANQAAFATFKTLAERQVDMIKAATEEFSKASSEILSAATFEEKATKQADVAKKAYEAAISNLRELSEIVAKSNTTSLDAINARVAELVEEVKALVAKKN